MPVLASSADARERRRVAAPPRAGFFLNVMLCRLKKRHTEVRLLRILLSQHTNHLVQRQIRLPLNQRQQKVRVLLQW